MQGNSSVTDRKLRVGYSMIFSPYDEQKSLGLNFSSLTAHSWIPSQVLHSDDLVSEKMLMEKNVRLSAKKNLTQLEIDNKKLQKELQRVEKERDNVLSRKEMVTGENMQLIMEAEEFHQVKADLTNQLRSGQNRIRGTVNVTLSCIFLD